MNDGGQQPSSSTVATGDDSANHDYIIIHDLFEDMVDNDGGGGDGEQIDVLGPEDAELFQILLTVWTRMTLCLGIRSG
jgi:hypothetical protein